MLYKARLWNPVSKSKYSYTPIPEGEGDTALKMKQVLMADINLEKISEYNKLSKGYNKKKIIRKAKNKIGRYRWTDRRN